MITSPRGVWDPLKANTREHKIEPPAFFSLWGMDKRKAKEGVIEHTTVITDIPNTLDPEMFIPIKPLPRNEFST